MPSLTLLNESCAGGPWSVSPGMGGGRCGGVGLLGLAGDGQTLGGENCRELGIDVSDGH
jgi:hypothetical protein